MPEKDPARVRTNYAVFPKLFGERTVLFLHYRWFADDESEKDELTNAAKSRAFAEKSAPVKRPRYFSRTMITGLLLAVVLFCYGQVKDDLPIVFLATAFILGGSRPLTDLLPPQIGRHLSNILFGFSIALFFGAIVMAFS